MALINKHRVQLPARVFFSARYRLSGDLKVLVTRIGTALDIVLRFTHIPSR